jgi:hypothetical protein
MTEIKLTKEEIKIIIESILFSISPDIISDWHYNFDESSINLLLSIKDQLSGIINNEFQGKLRVKLLDDGNGNYEDDDMAKKIIKLFPNIHAEKLTIDGMDDRSYKKEKEPISI